MPLSPDYKPPTASMAARRQGVANLRHPGVSEQKLVSCAEIAATMGALLDEVEYYQQLRSPTK